MKRDLIGFGTFCLGRRIHIGIPFDLPYSISSHLVLILTPTHLVKNIASPGRDPSNRQHFRPSQTVSVLARVAFSCPPGLCLLANFCTHPALHGHAGEQCGALASFATLLVRNGYTNPRPSHVPSPARNCGHQPSPSRDDPSQPASSNSRLGPRGAAQA